MLNHDTGTTVTNGYVGFNSVTPMPYASSDTTATVFYANETSAGHDAIYVVGGCVGDQTCVDDPFFCFCPADTNKCSYYIPSSDTWNVCADAPRNRYRHAWAKVNGLLCVIGGRNATGDAIIAEIDCYDPMTDSWTTPAVWTDATSLSSDNVAFGYGSKIYIIGGYDAYYTPLSTVTTYDLATGVWDYSLPSMAHARGDTQIGAVGGSYYVFGGWNAFNLNFSSETSSTLNVTSQTCNSPLNYVESFDPVTSTWSSVADMLYGRGDLAVGVLSHYVFPIAGERYDGGAADPNCTHSVPINYVARYDTVGKTWAIEANLTRNVFRFVGASYENESFSAIYLFGGQSGFDPVSYSFHLQNSTILYVPVTIATEHAEASQHHLSDAEIAGISIGAIVGAIIAASCVVTVIGRYAYLKYQALGTSEGSALVDEDKVHAQV